MYIAKFTPGNFDEAKAAAKLVKFFTYSEFYHHNGHNKLLNQTLTVVALSESPKPLNALDIFPKEEEPKKNTSYLVISRFRNE